ncbi:MAG: hypothetical protein VX610_01530 [SAR324 cluster bacterium]|nr:hypothetical protein [SAR324 cluster bacterium]
MRFSRTGILMVGLGMLWVSAVQAQQVDWERMDQRFDQLEKQMDQRFDQLEKRMVRMETTLQMFMESTNQRFEQVDQRFAELREDMNQRFAQVDQRFEQVMQTLQMIAAIFTAFFLAMLGYAWWDRRTIVRKAKEETLEALEKTEESRKNVLVEQVVAEVIRRLEARREPPSQSVPLPATS